MEKFEVNHEIIEYTIERKRIKNCYISVKDGKVSVRVPTKTSKEKIEEIMTEKAEWILKNVKKQSQKVQLPKKYENGEVFKVLGKETVLNISHEKITKPKIKFRFHKLMVQLPQEWQDNAKEETKKMVEYFYQNLAEKEVEKAMRKMSMKVGIAPSQYQVKNLKSTWGNCSVTGKISINKEVVSHSRRAINYVCLHEICHLENMNHSKDFWNMVETYMPDYKEAEMELKN